MVQYLYDKNIIIYTFAALGGLGLLLRVIVDLVYKHLVYESDRLGETKNKTLQHMKMKFSTCYKLKIGVNNVDTFVDKYVLKYRFCGVLLSTWDNICGLILFLNLLIVPIITVFAVAFDCGQDQILISGAVGIMSSAVLILVDKSFNITGKKKMLRLNLLDYLENFCKVRLEQEALQPELIEQYRREYFQAMEGKQAGTAATLEKVKEEPKDELNRRREARLKKEEEKRLLAIRHEEEHKKAEEARKEEEKRKLEERRQLAARRREEERLKMEEERLALEARRAELKKKAEEKQTSNEMRKQKVDEKEQILHSIEEELKTTSQRTDMNTIMKGVEEIAAENEQAVLERSAKVHKEAHSSEKPQKSPAKATKNATVNQQEEKLIEDVLKEFFA
ncbi:MAG TPA: hypothetical protein VN258_03165 [Mobilitalea sp.]|nr:hypothetical protein [Mobilitalea sp.]